MAGRQSGLLLPGLLTPVHRQQAIETAKILVMLNNHQRLEERDMSAQPRKGISKRVAWRVSVTVDCDGNTSHTKQDAWQDVNDIQECIGSPAAGAMSVGTGNQQSSLQTNVLMQRRHADLAPMPFCGATASALQAVAQNCKHSASTARTSKFLQSMHLQLSPQ